MEKLKSICKDTLSYIAERRLLRSSIVIIIVLLLLGTDLYNKYLSNKTNNYSKLDKEVSVEDENKNITSGTINTDVSSDTEYSKHTLGNGYSTLPDDYNQSSEQSTSSSSTSNNVDKSSITGIDLEILEGCEFNPKKDLKLKATDKDGSNISDNIIIEKNTVNTSIPGTYSVKVRVRLSDGQSKEKEFTVIVKETKLEVSLETFKPMKTNVNKGEKIGFEMDLKVSKKHVSPIAAMINGQEYPIYKGNENLFEKILNKKNYKIFINENNIPGLYEYNLEHIKMSNGSWISVGQNVVTMEVLKQEAFINNFSYEEQSKDKKIALKFDLEDLDNTASNLRLEFYKGDTLLESIKLDKMSSYSIDLNVASNGTYNIKILSNINLNQNINDKNTISNKEVFATNIEVCNIDQTSLIGNDIEIIKGQVFDLINDLGLKATDFDGEDITDKIQIEGNNIDTNTVGKQTVVVYITNKFGQKYTKEFKVTVIDTVTNDDSTLIGFSRIFSKQKSKSSYSRATNNSTANGNSSDTLRQSVDMTGIVSKSDGSMPNGILSVELPTAMAFMVDKDGVLTSGVYSIENKSSIGITVSVSEFRETKYNSGITVRPIDENISTMDRSNLHLALVGNEGRYVDLGKSITTPKEVLTVGPSSSSMIQLRGEAGNGKGKVVDDKGANEEFTLVFRINKS